ncbi:LigA [Rhodococcus opacus M213]|uniref:LigA n=1 Tax=Rhodococcus opacus M213 TaxID=1129896 RepID=K8X758_RHOOP|nr:LigA [Rhodococcus opacus M213]
MKGTYLSPEKRATTVSDIAQAWTAGLSARTASTQATYRTLVDSYVLPVWGDTPVSEVQHSDVVRWVADLSASGGKNGKALSAATVRQTHKLFGQILILAMRNGHINGNPADHVPLPRLPRKAPKFLTVVEVERVAAAADYLASQPKRSGARTDLHADDSTRSELDRDDDGTPIIPDAPVSENGLIVRLLAATGLRFGELAGLRVECIDLESTPARLHVVEAVVEVEGKLIIGEPKTHQARWVPFRSSLVPLLRAQMDAKAPTDHLFAASSGGPLRLRNWSRRSFTPAATLAGVSEDATVHWLRHSAATHALESGKNHVEVQQILGHAAPSITLDVYSHVNPAKLTAIGE